MEPVLKQLSSYLPHLVEHREDDNVQDFGLAQEQFFLAIALGDVF